MRKKFKVSFEGKTYDVEVEEMDSTFSPSIPTSVKPSKVAPPSHKPTIISEVRPSYSPVEIKPVDSGELIKSPLPGKILMVNCKIGDRVKKDDVLLVIDSMKMENEIRAIRDGSISDVKVSVGAGVSSGDVLLVID
ncbi:MAG: biotin/lipoyl-containing protein [Candidatus Bathyarchaeota archaeon]